VVVSASERFRGMRIPLDQSVECFLYGPQVTLPSVTAVR
jgi:hypothetical protein